ncbi:MAG: hypothetical protein LQ348_004063 [Seirophora lacunosa]|nr:MAG: hypothetical protein LQ344_002516 [Seirophora lacunosa]KAI4187609.1 MAG: hypothetical protein LQ348_004063 [Seirophora lacunosa]
MRPAPTAQNGSGGDEDSYMQSSPFMSSSMLQKEDSEEPSAVRSIAMCREEELEEIKKTYQSLASIHIYSLGPSTIQNLQILSECNRTAYENHKTEDPLEVGRQYGMIQNARVRRRAAAKHTPSIVTPIVNRGNDARKLSPAIKPESQPLMAPKSTYTQPRTSSLGEKKPRDQEKQHSTQENLLATQTPGLKREQSEIFSSFAKPRAKTSQRSTGSPAAASPAPQTESIASEEAAQVEEDAVTSEGSEIDSPEELPKSHERATKSSPTKRSEREEQLRRMMEDDGTTSPDTERS